MATLSKDVEGFYPKEVFDEFRKLFVVQGGNCDVGVYSGSVHFQHGSAVSGPDCDGMCFAKLWLNGLAFGSAINKVHIFDVHYRPDLCFNVEKVPAAVQLSPAELLADVPGTKETGSLYRENPDFERHVLRNLRKGFNVKTWVGNYPDEAGISSKELPSIYKDIYRIDLKKPVPHDCCNDVIHETEPRYLSRLELGHLAGMKTSCPTYMWADDIVPPLMARFLARQLLFCVTDAWKGKNFATRFTKGTFEYVAEPKNTSKAYNFSNYGVWVTK